MSSKIKSLICQKIETEVDENDVEETVFEEEFQMIKKEGKDHLRSDSEDERTEFYIEKGMENEEEGDEEETIAMFVTASGQQLALYAVEDSEEYFAVAVYDETGEPPSNFQFLMKSDVERLIREGAVRTVKKPSQIKKQLVTSQPPVLQTPVLQSPVLQPKEEITVHSYVKPAMKSSTKVIGAADSESEEEIVEQSTVQYMLCDGDQSDAELTFDEIQASLQGMKTTVSKSITKKPFIKKPLPKSAKTNNGLVFKASPPSSPVHNTSYRGVYYQKKNEIVEPPSPQPPVKRSHISNTSIIGSKQSHGIKQIHSPMLNLYTPHTSMNFSDSFTFGNSQSKVKRCRKQQLITVNRGDSEIIIQPASMLEEKEEEELVPKKKGKRRKKTAAHLKQKILPTRKSTRRRRTRVEIINIDIDENDSEEDVQEKEILEITIDENKEKDSSDKENEVIMVDSDDDDEEESLKCKHCSKNFKQQRAFDSHARVCTKLRGKSRRLNERRTRARSDSEEDRKNFKPKKEYSCKTCLEKFDMVVSLARHVRSQHTPRKRGRPSKADTQKLKEQMQVEVTRVAYKKKQDSKNVEEKKKKKEKYSRKEDISSEEEASEKKETPKTAKVRQTIVTIQPNKKKSFSRLNRRWSLMEQTCIKCSRWFTSVSALETHSLQHLTKKSGRTLKLKKVYSCPICLKYFKFEFAYLKHKKTHSKAEKSSEPGKSRKTKKNQSEGEEVSSKISANRNRKITRKLRSSV